MSKIPDGYIVQEDGSYSKIPRGRSLPFLNPPTYTPVAKLPKPKRIRQSSKPLLNKLETEFYGRLCMFHGPGRIKVQAWRVKLANGSWFKVDFCGLIDGQWMAWEVKGNKGKNIDRGKLALKVAAALWPEITWQLVWKDKDGKWQEQIILP